MNPEKYILELIPGLLKRYDKKKQGVTLDIGVGTFNFYFEVFHKSGYETYAIEPLPTQYLKDILTAKKIELIEACVLDYEGTVNIYSGIFKNEECFDVSSVNQDWWGIDEKSKVTQVKALTLKRIVEEHKIDSIAYIKIDTEGSEYLIVKQLIDFEIALLPKIIEFEYGGGANKKTGTGGWSSDYLKKTLMCINICYTLGYRYLLLFESSNEKPMEFDLNEIPNHESIFHDNYVYGNILMVQKRLFELDKFLDKKKPTLVQHLLRKFK